MAEQRPGEPPIDVTTIARDAVLMDALSRGETPPDDELGSLLGAWRADILADLPAQADSTVLSADATGLSAGAPVAGAWVAPPRRRGLSRMVIAGVAACVAALGAVTVFAADAGPGSPLWPITQVVYGERAESRVAQDRSEQLIAQARVAIAAKRYSDAEHLLDEADRWVDRVRDAAIARRLRAEIATVRGLLPGAGSHPSPGVNPTSTPAPTPPPGSSGGGATPTPNPLLPSLPLPSLPLPSLPVPSLPLPSLPLPPILRPGSA